MKRFTMVILFLWLLIVLARANQTDVIIQSIKSGDDALRRKNYPEAISFYKELLSSKYDIKADTTVCRALIYGGNCCCCAYRFVEALEFYIRGIEMAHQLGNENAISNCLNNVGIVYARFGDNNQALRYFRRAYDISLSNRNESTLAIATVNIMKCYSLLNQPDSIKVYYDKLLSYPLPNKIENNYYLIIGQALMANAHDNPHGSIYYYNMALDYALAHDMGNDVVADNYSAIAAIYEAEHNNDSVISVYSKLISILSKNQDRPDAIANAHLKLSHIFNTLGQLDSANYHKLKYLEASDSVFSVERFNSMRQLLNDQEDKIVSDRILSLTDAIRNRTVIIIVISLFFMAAIAIILIIIRNNHKLRKLNRLIIKKNDSLILQSLENQNLREQLVLLSAKSNNDTLENDETEEKLSLSLNEQQMTMLLAKIDKVMASVETIAAPDFSLNKLAKLVNSNTNYVSQAINLTYHKNFKTYLNECKINEAAKRLSQENKLTIQAIAEELGYKSMSNFVAVFKKLMGMTPSQYRKLSDEQ